MNANVDSNVRNLPIFKHFNENEISSGLDSFRKGEKGLFWFIKLGLLVAAAYSAYVYVLPPVMQKVGQMLGLVASGIILLAVILAMPVILKGLRLFTRALHKRLITYDPFAELDRQKQLMLQNQQKFRMSKGTIMGLGAWLGYSVGKKK